MDDLFLNNVQGAGVLLALLRVGPVVFLFPLFRGGWVPAPVKIGLALLLSLFAAQHAGIDGALIKNTAGFVEATGISIVIGLSLGLCVEFFFAAARNAGSYIGLPMGFSLSGVMDPATGNSEPLLSRVNFVFAAALFLILNGHHLFLQALLESFSLVPLAGGRLEAPVFETVIRLSGSLFSLALAMAAPAVLALFLTQVAMGVAGRAAPRMNLFFDAAPAVIAVGLLFFAAGLWLMPHLLRQNLVTVGKMMTMILGGQGG